MDLSAKARIYICFVVLVALAAVAYYTRFLAFVSLEQIAAFVLFILLGFLSEVYAIWIPLYGTEMSSSIAIYSASLFILGPAHAVLVVLAATLGSEILMRWDHLKNAPTKFAYAVTFNVSQWVVTLSIVGILVAFARTLPLTLAIPGDFLWALVGFWCCAGVNLALVTGIVTITERKNFFYGFTTSLKDFSLQYVSLFVSSLLLVVLYSVSIWHMFYAIVPLVLVHISFRSYLRLRTEARKTFERISALLDERDHYTAVHSDEVADLAVKIAQDMKLSQGEVEKVDVAGRVHDIGKMAIPDAILLKPGPLSEEEWRVMKRHPVVSAELIQGLEIYAPVVMAVKHEHERWDGSGYPDGLKGEEIPLVARIIAAADIFNALITKRPYREAFTHEEAIDTIRQLRGTDLDPVVAEALLRVVDERQP
ncbi:MAG TPA: HD-GYP domain-containing protein [Candidatus Heimdallarchaeota archaeon]|nr:HD-GYP domain-containing protein [Candidatus Heimdallarchaeota archaeon]